MAFPDYEQMADALNYYIYLSGGDLYALRPKQVYEPLANFFGLSEKERKTPRADGHTGSEWENRVQWTRRRLINEGKLDGQIRGVWRFSDDGINKALTLKHRFGNSMDDL